MISTKFITKNKTLASISLTLSITSSCLFAQNTIKVGLQDNDGSPLLMGDGSALSNPAGIGVDIIKLAAKELNIDLEIIREPNKRVQTSFEAGLFDASGFYSHNKDRENWGVFPSENGKINKAKRIFVQSYYIYAYPETNIAWDGEKMIGAKLIGANSGYSVVNNLKRLNIPVNEAKSIRQNLEMLSRGRIQGYAAQDAAIDPIIATYPEWGKLIKVGPPVKTKEYYFMFSHEYYKKNKKKADSFWKKIEEVRGDVIEKYRKMKIKPELK